MRVRACSLTSEKAFLMPSFAALSLKSRHFSQLFSAFSLFFSAQKCRVFRLKSEKTEKRAKTAKRAENSQETAKTSLFSSFQGSTTPEVPFRAPVNQVPWLGDCPGDQTTRVPDIDRAAASYAFRVPHGDPGSAARILKTSRGGTDRFWRLRRLIGVYVRAVCGCTGCIQGYTGGIQGVYSRVRTYQGPCTRLNLAEFGCFRLFSVYTAYLFASDFPLVKSRKVTFLLFSLLFSEP